MNKEELAAAVARDMEITLAEAEKIVTSVFDNIRKELQGGGSVKIKGFGKFSVAERAARRGRNPQKGEEVPIAPRLAPKFEAGKTLKAAVAEGKKQQ